MNSMNSKVDWYFDKDRPWQQELKKLRNIVLESGLTEELKWGCPTYTLEKNNIVLIHVFKEYCALLFMKGVLLKDPKHILIQQTKNVQSARQIRFTSMREIIRMKTVIKAYIAEAIRVENAGTKVKMKKTAQLGMPIEFKHALEKMPPLQTAFYKLTPGRQRGYLLYFGAAKQSKTREARIEKYADRILDGLGLDD